jgi:hypothetical protein
VLGAGRDAHAAGRAPPAAAAHRGVRNAGRAAGVEDGRATLHRHLLPLGIADRHRAVPAQPGAQLARRQGGQADGGETQQEVELKPIEAGDLRLVGKVDRRGRGIEPAGHGHQPVDLLPGPHEAEQRQHRDQQRGGEQVRRGGRIPRLQAQPEVQAEAAMHPGDDEADGLAQPDHRREHPGRQHDEAVGVVGVEQLVGHARAQHVQHHERRHQQPEHELRRLPGMHAHGAPPVERPEGEREMRRQRAVEDRRAGRVAPQRQEPQARRLLRLERDEARGMVEEVRREIGEQDHARDQTHGPQSRAGDGDGQLHPRAILRALGDAAGS